MALRTKKRGSEGQKLATCTATHTWKCSATNKTKITTESASISNIQVKLNTTNIPTINPPNNGELGLPEVSVPKTLLEVIIHLTGARSWIYWEGNMKEIVADETFTKADPSIPKACGSPWKENKNSASNSVTISYKGVGVSIPLGNSVNGIADVEGIEFKRIHPQWFARKLKPKIASFTGSEINEHYSLLGTHVSTEVISKEDYVFTPSGNGSLIDYIARHETVDCCPM